MSVSMWAWTETKCEQNPICCGECDKCPIKYEDEESEGEE